MGIWTKKPLNLILSEASNEEKGLKRSLGPMALISLGIGAIIGAGLFVRTAAGAAEHAGPSVTIGFIIAAIGCAFAGLCYAELSSSIPISGSAYTYSFATMGEMVAWIIGWDLVLEYAVGASMVGIAWSEYLNNLLVNVLHLPGIPYDLCHSPIPSKVPIIGPDGKELVINGVTQVKELPGGIINLPALGIVVALTQLLVRGIKESAVINNIIVVAKVAIVIMLIVFGWQFINPAHHTPYVPEPSLFVNAQGIQHDFGGWLGIIGAAGVVFFAFIGFDAVSTAAQEAKNPNRDMPIGILGSLAICTVLYILFAHVLTGLAPVEFFRSAGKEASVAQAIATYMPGYGWLSSLITVAILAGFSSVILVMLMGQSRVFYSMSKDGLLPARFAELHPKFRTPANANYFVMILVGLVAAFVPGDIVGDMSSIGTLFAFILVCAGVIILRKTEPNLVRRFRTPLVPVVPILGIVFCLAMMVGLGWVNWLRLVVWLLIGMVIYFGYSRKHSRIGNPEA